MPDTPPSAISTDASANPCDVLVGTNLEAGALPGCDITSGQVITFYYEEPKDVAPSKEKVMEPKTVVPNSDAPPAAAPAAELAAPAPSGAGGAVAGAEAPSTAEHVEVDAASPSAGELGDLISQSGGGAVGLIAALIAVVGGTAGFKLWTKISEQKHEQSMKKLDIEQANAGLSGAQPPPCQSAHQALVADIKALQGSAASLEARVEKLEKASAGFDPSVDVGDLEERVEVLEKTFRKKARATGGV